MRRSTGRSHLSTRQSQGARLLVAAAVTGVCSLALAGPASAQYVTPKPPLTGSGVDSQTLTQLSATNADVDAAVSRPGGVARTGGGQSGRGGLPVTGGDVVGLTALGAGAIASERLLVRLHGRQSRT